MIKKFLPRPALAVTCLVLALTYPAIWTPVLVNGSPILSTWEANVGLILALAVPLVIFAPSSRWVLLVVLWLVDSLRDEVVASLVHRAPVDPASLVLVLVPGVALGLAYWRADRIERDAKKAWDEGLHRAVARAERAAERAERAAERLSVATTPPPSPTTPWAVLAVVLFILASSRQGHREG